MRLQIENVQPAGVISRSSLPSPGSEDPTSACTTGAATWAIAATSSSHASGLCTFVAVSITPV